MKRTEKYKFPYFEEGDKTNSVYEVQRWVTIDTQLYGLFSLFGNGIIDGWNIVMPDKLTAKISKGKGIIDFVSVESKNGTSLRFVPNAISYIYATIVRESYWDRTVKFVVYSSKAEKASHIYIGLVQTDATKITKIDISERPQVGIPEEIIQKIAEHKHSGGIDESNKIDLATEVDGILPIENMPNLDASIVTSGVFDKARLPNIDHNNLTNKGSMTHAEIDTAISTLSDKGCLTVGQKFVSDMLRTSLAMKLNGCDIDNKTKNQILFVPGLDNKLAVDTNKTTATVNETIVAKCGNDKKYFYTQPINLGKDVKRIIMVSDYSTDGSVETRFSLISKNNEDAILLDTFVNLKAPTDLETVVLKIEFSGNGTVTMNNFAIMYC